MNAPATFRRRITDVRAIQYDGTNAEAVKAFAGESFNMALRNPPRCMISSPSGELVARVGDWVAQNPTDATDFYVIASEQFDKLYNPEPVET